MFVNSPGDYGGGVIPDPFPNSEVKPSRADDTTALSGGKVGRRQAFFCPFEFCVIPDPRPIMHREAVWMKIAARRGAIRQRDKGRERVLTSDSAVRTRKFRLRRRRALLRRTSTEP